MNIKVSVSMNKAGYVVMDEMMALIHSLPKVQQSIIHYLIEEQFLDLPDDHPHRRIKANWLYSGE